MLTIEQITNYFNDRTVKANKQGMLIEYLQYEILDSIFKNKEAGNLSFIGGTSIRIIHDSLRFSEDLDFDNFGLDFNKFEGLMLKAVKDMQLKGFLIEYKSVFRGAYHCYIRFPLMLNKLKISADERKKVLIRIDSEKKEKTYKKEKYLLNKFAVYQNVFIAPKEVLLAQKMITVLNRKREKGRDLFDVSFLSGIARPDYEYILKSLNLSKGEFLELFEKRILELDLEYLAKDVEPFLFYPEQKNRITTFLEYFNQHSW